MKMATTFCVLFLAFVLECRADLGTRLEDADKAIKKGLQLFPPPSGFDTDEDYRGNLWRRPPEDFKLNYWGRVNSIMTVLNVVDQKTMLVSLSDFLPIQGVRESKPVAIILKGFDTTEVTSDTAFLLPIPVVVTGTTTYKAVSGTSKKVLVLERKDKQIEEVVTLIKRERIVALEKAREKYDTFCKIVIPADEKGMSVYANFPEEDRLRLIQDWNDRQAELTKEMENGVAFIKNKSTKGAARSQHEKLVSKARTELSKLRKNNPPYLKKPD